MGIAPGIEYFPGIAHSDELFFQWYNPDRPLNEEDSEFSLRLTTMWTNFVKYGDPTPPETELGFAWEPSLPDQKR